MDREHENENDGKKRLPRETRYRGALNEKHECAGRRLRSFTSDLVSNPREILREEHEREIHDLHWSKITYILSHLKFDLN